jgi:hypothetical protein
MRAFVFLLALSTAGCSLFGPTKSVEGEWTGRLPKNYFICLTLQQDGDTITGTATAVSDGFLLYSGVPVRGDHPDLSFTVSAANTAPCCAHLAGTAFSGRQDSTEDIVGRYGNGDIRFNLAGESTGNQCTATRTSP